MGHPLRDRRDLGLGQVPGCSRVSFSPYIIRYAVRIIRYAVRIANL